MNSAARRNRLYAKRRSERTKWDPFLEKHGFVLLRLRFKARRRRLTLFPPIILEVMSSYGSIRSLVLNGSMRSPRVAQPWTTDPRGSEATRAC